MAQSESEPLKKKGELSVREAAAMEGPVGAHEAAPQRAPGDSARRAGRASEFPGASERRARMIKGGIVAVILGGAVASALLVARRAA